MKKMIIPVLFFVLFFLGCSNPTSSDPSPAPIQPSPTSPEPNPEPEDNKVTVSFDSQGGIAMSSLKVEPGSTVETLPVSEKFTYHFDGWYTAVNGGGTEFLATTIVEEDITVYASWIQTAVVTTLAGSGSKGSSDGSGTSASFNLPSGAAVDSAGNLYVSDAANNLIRKITPAGVVTTLAGSGMEGSNDGSGTSASFKDPRGVAVDGAGNVYVADKGNNVIRKITANGVVTTLAGIFNEPHGVAVDSAGTVYVADAKNNVIRKITANGVVTTLAGSGTPGSSNGTGTAASFNFPSGVAVDGEGNLYVVDGENNLIRKITPAGVVTTLAGSGTFGSDDGTGTAASFWYPYGIAVDSAGNLYVADTGSSLIRKITPAGAVTTLAGNSTPGSINGTGTAASFYSPRKVAVDSEGIVYVADTFNHLIRKITQ